jgi:alkaline phosphatase
MPYVIDRKEFKDPSLPEMAQKALDILSARLDDSDTDANGFFLLIEGSRIDMAAHK